MANSNYAKKLFRLSSLFYGARRRLSFFLIRVDNDSRGGIQLSDYRMGALIDTVDNHEGHVCSHSIAFLLLKRTGSQYHTGSTSFMDLARKFECEIRGNSVYMGRRAFERHFKKRVSPPNGGQNLKNTYSDLQRQAVGPEKLKEALGALGLKVGGTLQQRAERLFLTKDYNCSSQMFRPANFTRTYLGYVLSLRSLLPPELVPSLLEVKTISLPSLCSTSSTKYGGVKKIAYITVSELNAYALNASCNGQKLKETDIAIGSGEIPVNPTPLLNETTTAAQTTLMKA
ncbi:hypothetical protein HID58_065128 [Brassica napus]|uniref:Uncharacterized protein n=1 Tax=Brassica napus TaxID=3708 RepID=A0ABQ7ZC90_BRANA|nr:hypothetical protein HID58_065128 [Brassica napus]